MNLWNILSTIAVTLAVCGVAVVALGCIWPADPPLYPRTHTYRVPAPTAWTCGLPGTPLSLDDAHNALHHHRNHDCPREHVAYATLVAYDRIPPGPVPRQAPAVRDRADCPSPRGQWIISAAGVHDR